jgi:hypothetical protein
MANSNRLVAWCAVACLLAVIFLSTIGLAGEQGPPANEGILSGSDVGFRVEETRGSTVVGRWVVRVDGRWVEPELSAKARPAR